MKIQTQQVFFSGCLIFLLFVSHSQIAVTQEAENEREFDYMKGSEKGPAHWGELKKEWAVCKNGSMQSPVDMSNRRVKIIQNSGELTNSYKPCNATVKNRGHDISLQWEGEKAGSIQINETDYFLEQCHWHSPSEHTINGRRYDLELHIVHTTSDPSVENKRAVIGILYRIGQPDTFLSKFATRIPAVNDQKLEMKMGMIDPSEIKLGGKGYYRYMGSLTVPPCTEGVIWTINRKVGTVSKDQVRLLRMAVHDYAEMNARPLQPLNQREIYFYGANPEQTSN